jgi:hypothetical protein
MNRRRVGEDRGSKEMDGCPLTCFSLCVGMVPEAYHWSGIPMVHNWP